MWLTFAAMAIATPIVLRGVLLISNNTTDMNQWLPAGREEVDRYEQFQETFGVDDFVVVSWDGCTLDDPRVERLAEALRSFSESREPLWRQVLSGPEMLARLTENPLGLSRDQAVRRLRGLVLGIDGETTCLYLPLTLEGREQPRTVIQVLTSLAQSACGISEQNLHLAGSVYKVAMIDQESERTLRAVAISSSGLALLITLLLLGSLRLTMIVLVTAGFSGAMSVAIVHYGGGSLNAVLIVLPSLVFVLAVSAAVHLANYYRDAVAAHGSAEAASHALRMGLAPCALAAATTAVGMASLVVSDLAPVRQFGLYSAASLLLALVVVLSCFYSILRAWPYTPRAWMSWKPSVDQSRLPFQWFFDGLVRHNIASTLICLGLVALAALGLRNITASVDLFRIFRPHHPLIHSYQWFERHIGPLAAIELVVTIPNAEQTPLIERLERLRAVEDAIRRLDGVGPTLSALAFAPEIPESGGIRGTTRRTLYKRKFEAQQQQLIDEGWLAEAEFDQMWRIHIRVPEFSEDSLSQAIQRIDDSIRSSTHVAIGDLELQFTGGFPLIEEAQKQLLNDLRESFMLAFVVLCPVMMVVLRSWKAGLIAMIPNVAPVLAVFGVMGWLGVPVQIGTMLTASVALGIALDATLHFLTWFQRSLERGASRPQAIQDAIRQCAPAMIQTTLICGGGMLLFIPASFVPASQFALLMVVLLTTASVSDLVIMPSILATPLGAVFETRKGARGSTKPTTDDPKPPKAAADRETQAAATGAAATGAAPGRRRGRPSGS